MIMHSAVRQCASGGAVRKPAAPVYIIGMELLIGAAILLAVSVALRSAAFGSVRRPPRAVYRILER